MQKHIVYMASVLVDIIDLIFANTYWFLLQNLDPLAKGSRFTSSFLAYPNNSSKINHLQLLLNPHIHHSNIK